MPISNVFETGSQAETTTGQPDAPFADRWAALHGQAQAIAHMAALAAEPLTEELSSFPETLEHAGELEQELASRGIDDIDAILQPGVTALLTIQARGQDATAPALALWREFYCARKALLDLCHPEPS